ncbi:hypothetical protein ACWIUD_03980 [Helicobacter sp. 23-1044]
MKVKSLTIWDFCFAFFVAVYAFCIIYKSAPPLMSGDDINYYADLVEGRAVWHGVDFDYKRFFPLAGWNLNLVASISTSPYAFMIGNALVFAITALCYYALLRSFGVAKSLIAISFATLTLSAGYTKIITQLAFTEMTQIMFLMIFLLCGRLFYENCAKVAESVMDLTHPLAPSAREGEFADSAKNTIDSAKNTIDSAFRAKVAESKTFNIYIYIYICVTCAHLCKRAYLSQRSFIYFN